MTGRQFFEAQASAIGFLLGRLDRLLDCLRRGHVPAAATVLDHLRFVEDVKSRLATLYGVAPEEFLRGLREAQSQSDANRAQPERNHEQEEDGPPL